MNTESNPIALIRQTTTVSIAFLEKPSEERRKRLWENGYRYANGAWFKPVSQSQMATEELVAQVLAAA